MRSALQLGLEVIGFVIGVLTQSQKQRYSPGINEADHRGRGRGFTEGLHRFGEQAGGGQRIVGASLSQV